MRLIPGRRLLMGSSRFYAEEMPRRLRDVAPFWLDRTLVTNAQFARFVQAAGYRTMAERREAGSAPGSLVFGWRDGKASPGWTFVEGACWRAPNGPASSVEDLAKHPVVHVTVEDAATFAAWAGKRLPTEPEWECAARAGLEDADYSWGDELHPSGAVLANIWMGEFPRQRSGGPRFPLTTPVGSYPEDGYGLVDMIGNVWEITADPFLGCASPSMPVCCAGDAPSCAGQVVIKGGSHLCAENWCQRYRPAARQGQPRDSPASHIGFRCARELAPAM